MGISRQKIQNWLNYWHFTKMVAVDQINAFDQVYQARKYCQCMRSGIFEDVSDLAIWNALVDLRSGTLRPKLDNPA